MQEPRSDTNFTGKFFGYIFVFLQKFYAFQYIEYFKKTLLYLHNHNYVNSNMLYYKQDFPLHNTFLQVKKN